MQVLTAPDQPRIASQLERDDFFWLDLESPSPEDFHRIGGMLGLHPMAMEDTREFGQRPKVDVYEGHVLVAFYTAEVTEHEDPVVRPLEVHVYVSGDFILTVRRDPCMVLDRLRDELASQDSAEEEYLVYRIFDTLTDAWYPAVTAIERHVDALEAEVLARARREQLSRIYRLRQEVREHYRLMGDQRDHFRPASEAIRNLGGLRQGARAYLRDVADHLAQIAGELQRQNEDLGALAQTYFNANADRLNAVATRLTVFGTLFLTWTLVTGFFGQNFGYLVDSIDSKGDFLVYGVGGLVVPTVVLGVVFWRKRRDWF
jgi:magnesium transporter